MHCASMQTPQKDMGCQWVVRGIVMGMHQPQESMLYGMRGCEGYHVGSVMGWKRKPAWWCVTGAKGAGILPVGRTMGVTPSTLGPGTVEHAGGI